MKEELKASNIYNVQQIQFGVDNCIEQIDSIVTQFSLNDNIDVKSDLQDVASTMLMKTEFEHYLQISDYLAEIGLFIIDDQYMITSKTSLKPYLYYNLILTYDDETVKNAFAEALIKPESAIIPSNQVNFYNQSEEFLTFIKYVPGMNADESANLIFWVDAEYIEELVNVEGRMLEYIILDSEYQEVFSTITNSYDMYEIYEYIEAGNTSFEYMGQLIAVQESENSGLKFISITALDSVYAVINQSSKDLILAMILIFVIGAIVIYISMGFTYKPIANVSQRMLEYVPKKNDDKNEIQFIEESLDYLVNKNEKLFDNTKKSSKIYLLRSLLQGAVGSREEFNVLGKGYELHWNKEYFTVFSIVFCEKDEKFQVPSEKLEVTLNNYFTGYVFRELQCKYTFIANLSEQELTVFHDGVQDLNQVLHDEYEGVSICIGIGNVYRETRDIPKSYAEATVAADYRFVRGMDSVIVQQDLITEQNITYPYHLLEKFKAAFKNQNEKTTYETLDEIVTYVKTNHCPIHYARSICYDLISILSEAFDNMGAVDVSKKIDGYYNKILADSLTVEEMIEVSRNICTNLQAYVREDNKKKSQELLEDIKLEIMHNCFDINFSVEGLADMFDMTFPGISALFKNKTGQTIIEYVTEIRMEKAKYYLENTDMSVAKITEEIGYISPSSFIRKFKGIYGVTPKQYASSYRLK